ncbi:MAG: NADPH:quinone reductase [Pseudomonadota bacterium]
MRAAHYTRTGPAAEVLQVGDWPDPVAGDGEVLVRLSASGINPADVKRRGGWGGLAMEHPAVIPHCDGAGTVVAVGAGVEPERVGTRVWLWNAQGGYGESGRAFGTAAEYVALPSAQAVPLADGVSFAQGACLGVPAMTAYACVMADGPITGQTLLVQGGAGAVGHLAIQIAKAGGARVLATVSGPEGAAHAAAAGAETIDRHRHDVAARVLDETDGSGVDRVVEVDLAANQETDIAVLRRSGTLASYSSSSDPTPPFPYYSYAAKGLTLRIVQGFGLPRDLRAAGQAFLATTPLEISVGATFSLDQIAQAHARVERGALGQTVIDLDAQRA